MRQGEPQTLNPSTAPFKPDAALVRPGKPQTLGPETGRAHHSLRKASLTPAVQVPCMIVMSMADEYVPPEIDKAAMAGRIAKAVTSPQTLTDKALKPTPWQTPTQFPQPQKLQQVRFSITFPRMSSVSLMPGACHRCLSLQVGGKATVCLVEGGDHALYTGTDRWDVSRGLPAASQRDAPPRSSKCF